MGRANTIIVGSVVLAPLILGIEGYFVFRPHHRARAVAAPAVEEPAPAVSPPAPGQPVVAAQPPPSPAPPAPGPSADERAPAAETSPPSDAWVEAEQDPSVVQRQRILREHRRVVIRAADEKAFDTLNLPNDQRAAIRSINDQYVRSLQALQAASAGAADPNSGVDLNADQTRRAAITNVLGAEGMPAFNLAERKAEHRVRAELRPQLVRGH